MDERQADQKSGKGVGSSTLREEKYNIGEEREVKYWLGSQRIVGLSMLFAGCSNKWSLEPLSCLFIHGVKFCVGTLFEVFIHMAD